jgi:hypothetical protein
MGDARATDRFRAGRVFIAGDAARLWVPYGGYGMNAGIADVLNLTWTLGAILGGWAGPAMINAYESERRPITAHFSKFAMSHAERVIQNRHAVPQDIEDDTEEGEQARACSAALVDLLRGAAKRSTERWGVCGIRGIITKWTPIAWPLRPGPCALRRHGYGEPSTASACRSSAAIQASSG